MTAGARYGYLLVWVVVAGNLMAMLVQYLSAKIGIVTGASLPEVLGRHIRRPFARRLYWLQAELVAMATDLAEVIGGAVALNLLFGLPLFLGGVITGVISMAVLAVQSRRGPRSFERAIVATETAAITRSSSTDTTLARNCRWRSEAMSTPVSTISRRAMPVRQGRLRPEPLEYLPRTHHQEPRRRAGRGSRRRCSRRPARSSLFAGRPW